MSEKKEKKLAIVKWVEAEIHNALDTESIKKILRAEIKKRVKKAVIEVLEQQILSRLENETYKSDDMELHKTVENLVIDILKDWR